MDYDRNAVKRELAERVNRFNKISTPTGFAKACQSADIDIEIFEYADCILGLAHSFLSGSPVDAVSIDRGDNLDQKLSECEKRIHDLKAYKDLISEIASLLTDCLITES